VRPTHQNIICN